MDPNIAYAVAMAALASHHQLKPPGLLHPNPLGPPSGMSSLPPPAVDPISPVVQPGRCGPLDLDPHLHHRQQLTWYFLNPYQEPIKTIFISGLPDDVKPREIDNLFRCCYGFESCQLKYTGRGDQEYKCWLLRTIEDTWNLFEKKFTAIWKGDGSGDAYLPGVYNNSDVQLLVRKKYMKDLFHDSLGFGAAKMIRRILGVALVEDLESIQDAATRAACAVCNNADEG